MWLKNQCGAIIKLFCSDSGKEHVSVEMLSFMQDNEIRSQTRCPCTAEQKVVAERKISSFFINMLTFCR